jgi:hypothetical protein
MYFKSSYINYCIIFQSGLRASESRVLGGIFRPNKPRVIGGWRKLHNDELHNLYSSPNNILVTKL